VISTSRQRTCAGRAAAQNIIRHTGAAKRPRWWCPSSRQLDGMAMRLPVMDGSVTDLV